MAVAVGYKVSAPAQDSAGRWLDVIREDDDMVRRWLNVMYQMDRNYLFEGRDTFGRSMGHRPSPRGASYYYWTASSAIALRMVFIPVRKQHQILSVGFVGELSPAEALDLIVDKAISYLKERGATSAFALCPKRMDNPNILKLYDLVPSHPRLRVTTVLDAPQWRHWNLEPA